MTTYQLEAFKEVYGVAIDPDEEPVEFFMALLRELNKMNQERNKNDGRNPKSKT